MSTKLKSNTAVASRIKKMMQSDEDVGKVAKASPVLIAAALDAFLDNIMASATDLAQERGAKLLTSSHLKYQVVANPLHDFCKDLVADVADLPADEEGAPKPKRPRSANAGGESKPKKPKGKASKKTEDDEDWQPADDAKFEDDVQEEEPQQQQQQQQQQQPTEQAIAQPEEQAVNLGIPAFMMAAPAADDAEEEDYDA